MDTPAQQPEALTPRLASFVRNTALDDIPAPIRHEAKRSLMNFFATALGGSGEPAIDKSLTVLGQFSGTPSAGIIGRRERADMLLAAYVNAMSANIFDFDDTHPATIIHPTAPVAPTLFAHAASHPCSGEALLRAFILGAEIECRVGNAVSLTHYDRGWHITSTCGVFGSAMGVGALIGLNEEQLTWTIANAAVQAAGLVEALGTMSKSISVGNAARNGIVSALLGAEGFSGPAAPMEGTRGFLTVFSDTPKPEALCEGLGEEWEIGKNTYKPYPVGVVLNPVVEATLALAGRGEFGVEDVARINLRGHPLLERRTNRPDVATGRESQVSAQHAIAIVLRRGRAGLAEFNDDAVTETARDGIRPDVRFTDDEACPIEAVKMEVVTHNGATHAIEIAAAQGGPTNPMSDGDLELKLAMLADYGGFSRGVEPIAKAVWCLETQPDAAAVLELATVPG